MTDPIYHHHSDSHHSTFLTHCSTVFTDIILTNVQPSSSFSFLYTSLNPPRHSNLVYIAQTSSPSPFLFIAELYLPFSFLFTSLPSCLSSLLFTSLNPPRHSNFCRHCPSLFTSHHSCLNRYLLSHPHSGLHRPTLFTILIRVYFTQASSTASSWYTSIQPSSSTLFLFTSPISPLHPQTCLHCLNHFTIINHVYIPPYHPHSVMNSVIFLTIPILVYIAKPSSLHPL